MCWVVLLTPCSGVPRSAGAASSFPRRPALPRDWMAASTRELVRPLMMTLAPSLAKRLCDGIADAGSRSGDEELAFLRVEDPCALRMRGAGGGIRATEFCKNLGKNQRPPLQAAFFRFRWQECARYTS